MSSPVPSELPCTPRRSRKYSLLLTCALILSGLLGVAFFALVLFPWTPFARALSMRSFIAQALAFPHIFGACVVAVSALVLFFARRLSSLWIAASTQGVWALSGVLLIIFPSTITAESSPIQKQSTTGITLNIVAFNTQNSFTHADMATLISAFDPDIVVLPETTKSDATRAAGGTAFANSVYGYGDLYSNGIALTTIMVHPRLGGVTPITEVPEVTFGTVGLKINSRHQFRIFGVHTYPPVPNVFNSWEWDLDRVISFGENNREGPLILAGDFNATLRHGPLANRQRLVDTARRCSRAPAGAWPSNLPFWLRTPIDHVFVTPEFEVLKCSTMMVGTSDHLAYAATVRLSE